MKKVEVSVWVEVDDNMTIEEIVDVVQAMFEENDKLDLVDFTGYVEVIDI